MIGAREHPATCGSGWPPPLLAMIARLPRSRAGYTRGMGQRWNGVWIMALVSTGCLWERNVDRRLTRMQVGVTSRQVGIAAPDAQPGVARTITPPAATPALVSSGVTGALQFTMRARRNVYLGGEVEAGPLEQSGYFGGAYGVAGAEVSSSVGSLSVELTAGRQWVRTELGADNVPRTMLEPRVRAQLPLTPQITIGGVIGASALPDDRGWMAGIFVGMYSFDLNRP